MQKNDRVMHDYVNGDVSHYTYSTMNLIPCSWAYTDTYTFRDLHGRPHIVVSSPLFTIIFRFLNLAL